MQYLLLIHDDESVDHSDLIPEYGTYTEALRESGSFLGANQLQPSDTAEMIRGCPCSDGCPSCVQSPKCGNLNDMLDKAGALTFLSRLLIRPAL